MPAQRSINPIDNFHVKGFAFPLPGASHTHYLAHRPVVAHLWDVIIDRRYSYLTLKNRGENGKLGKDYPSVLIRPGKGRGDRGVMATLLVQQGTLHKGDVILCGTSLGVLPMKPGTPVEVEISLTGGGHGAG